MSVPASLAPWVDAGVFGPAEAYGAEVITRAAGDDAPLVVLAAAFALWAPLHGHTCIDVARVDELVELAITLDDSAPAGDRRALAWPDARRWIDELRSSAAVRVVDDADPAPVLDGHPLVLHAELLYTQRQWIDECSVAAALLDRAGVGPPVVLCGAAAALLERLLPALDDDGDSNLQQLAARAIVSSRLTLLVGGPGTGKTHTLARTLAVLLADATARGTPLRIALAAPTGKAAARMRDAVAAVAAGGQQDASLSPGQAAGLSELQATTIHRLLGARDSTTRFTRDAGNPLPDDVVIIDEASMISLPLMARLLEALRPEARLVLVGDPDQLHSVEAGAVLADAVTAGTGAARAGTASGLGENVVRLRRPRRQQSGSPLGALADAVRDNRADTVVDLLRAGALDPVSARPLLSFIEHPDPLTAAGGAGIEAIVSPPLIAAAAAARAGDPGGALARLCTIRVLCAHRRGSYGAENWNRAIETWVLGVAPDLLPARLPAGRALLVTRNDARRGLANGDTGIAFNDPAGVRAAFVTTDGLRILAPAQLEGIQTAFATTVHKSQGSEYPTVVVILPPPDSPLAGCELLYTALTRATERLVVVGTCAAVVACVQTSSRRVTGLSAALRGRR